MVSQEAMNVRDSVQMMAQDMNQEVRSEHDLGFMTEVDAEFRKPDMPGKESAITDQINSTRHSEIEGTTTMPPNRSSMLEIEKAEFKDVINQLVTKEESD